jgi:hypothetical protein
MRVSHQNYERGILNYSKPSPNLKSNESNKMYMLLNKCLNDFFN